MSLIVCKINNSFIDSYHIVYITASPRNVILTAPNSTTLLLHWEPPEEDPRDGTILQYSIVCRFGDSDSLLSRNSSASSQSLQLTDLHPFTNYNCCVSAQRTNGNSPESCSSKTTAEDGKKITNFIVKKKNWGSHWQSSVLKLICDPNHTCSLASFHLLGLSNKQMPVQSENCLQFQKKSPQVFCIPFCARKKKNAWPVPTKAIYSHPQQLPCAQLPFLNPCSPPSPIPSFC